MQDDRKDGKDNPHETQGEHAQGEDACTYHLTSAHAVKAAPKSRSPHTLLASQVVMEQQGPLRNTGMTEKSATLAGAGSGDLVLEEQQEDES
jgi:hypothetical protein